MKPYLARASEQTQFEFFGLRITDYTAERDLASSLAIIDVPIGARHPSAHSERCEKAYFGLSGRVRFTLGAGEMEIGRGDLLVIPVGACFSYEGINDARIALFQPPPYDSSAEVLDE